MNDIAKQPEEQYGIYRVTGKNNGGLIYYLVEGPYTDRKRATRKAEAMNKREADIYFSYVVSEFKGDSWSPKRPDSFNFEKGS